MKTLLILNDAPYGSERTYNGLRLAGSLARDAQASQVALVRGTPHQFVMVPMKAPVLVGYVLMGFPINQKLVDDMRAISDMHLALISDAGGQRGQIVASTLSPEAEQALRERIFQLALDRALQRPGAIHRIETRCNQFLHESIADLKLQLALGQTLL